MRLRRAPKTASPRILVHVVHYFGRDSAFEGRSTRSDESARRATVERVVETLQKSPYDMEVAVCGIPDSALVPVDVDLGDAVDDPRHLVYAAIQSLTERVDDGFDYFMCVEDDVLVPPETIDRMIRFGQHARVNEVLLPNRLDESPSGERYCVDLLVVPGWRGLRRKFEGRRLDVAVNPHSGLAFLSREQVQYARRRVRLRRRERFLGGPMASAFANLHLPFLLWRVNDDLAAHHVIHLDRWESPGAHLSVPGQQLGITPEGARGLVDEVTFDGVVARVRGWLVDENGSPGVLDSIRIGERLIEGATFTFHERPDVPPNVPGASPNCGFLARFSLLDLTETEVARSELTVGAKRVALRAVWPSGPAYLARSSAPSIPDEPHMPSAAQDRLGALIADARCYLEYGTGGSTMLAARVGLSRTYCVESDESWLEALKDRLRKLGGLRDQVFIHADIGPTGDWGFPRDIPHGTAAPDYALAVWERLRADGASPDLVLIDGRYRAACLLATFLHASPGTRVVFDDYLDRPHYAAVEEVAVPVAYHDRVAEFEVPAEVDRERAWRLLARYGADAR